MRLFAILCFDEDNCTRFVQAVFSSREAAEECEDKLPERYFSTIQELDLDDCNY